MVDFGSKKGSKNISKRVLNYAAATFFGCVFFLNTSSPAYAFAWDSLFASINNGDLSHIAEGIVKSLEDVPGLLTAFAYLLGLLLAVLAVFKLKEHVENPTQVPLRHAIARFVIGGALLALPLIFEAMRNSINGGVITNFEPGEFSIAGLLSGLQGILGGILGGLGVFSDANFIMAAIVASVRFIPGLITAFAYLFGMILCVWGLLKAKDHIENPEQTALKESVIRLLVGGALFALPTVYEAMKVTIRGDASFNLGAALSMMSDLSSVGTLIATCGIGSFLPSLWTDTTLGNLVCGLITHTGAFQSFFTALGYLFGSVMGVWGILKIQDHVLNPSQTSIWEGISRIIAAGCFFSFPFMVAVMKNTVAPTGLAQNFLDFVAMIQALIVSILSNGIPTCDGLDGAVSCFMNDIYGPMTLLLSAFTLAAGMVLIMIGISRLIKSSQEGAKAPGGLGTMMTFLVGGALVSFNNILKAVSGSIVDLSAFSGGGLSYGTLNYTAGMSTSEVAHAKLILTAIMQLMVVVGMISFARGLFIVRNVAEGNGQASIMAGFTHIIGGAAAVNLGPLLNAVQQSLGIAGYGITFS